MRMRLLLALLLCAAMAEAGAPNITTRRIVNGFTNPVAIAHVPGDATRLFVCEQATGNIRIINLTNNTINATPFVTVTGIHTGVGEQGLLGLAFHPDYATNGAFYVYYTGGSGAGSTFVAQYKVSANPDIADAASKAIILQFTQPEANHNGGWLGFDPTAAGAARDYLYISTGDGGGANDRHGTIGNSQDRTNLLGKMLRIQVNTAYPGSGAAYTIPAGNPYSAPNAPEIWAFGLRNPWRCSFDRTTGDMWIGDVGQGAREEIDLLPANTPGLNFGWRPREGLIQNPGYDGSPYPTENPITAATDPIHDYPRTSGITVIGGYRYRGSAIPGLGGTYFFADYGSATFWAATYSGGAAFATVTDVTAALAPGGGLALNSPTAFGEDALGEIYVTDYVGGEIFKIIPALTISNTSPLSPTSATASYNLTFNGANGQAPYTFALDSGTLPTGFSLSSAGVLSGTTNQNGIFNFTVRVTDALAVTATKAFALLVNAAPSVTTASLPNGNINVAYSQNLAGANGTTPYTWTLDSGMLPDGLTLSSGGTISGTPSVANTFNFTVRLTDAAGATNTRGLSIQITNVLSVVTLSLPPWTINRSYSQTLTATGGTGGYQWSVISGSLPDGLNLTAGTGALSGTPTVANTFNFTVQVRDSINSTATQALTIVVNPAPSVTTTSLPNPLTSENYSHTLQHSGGTAPFTWDVSAGAPPAGFSLSAAGVLSGLSNTVISGSFTVRVTDAAGAQATQPLTLTVEQTTYGLPGRLPTPPYLSMPTTVAGALPPLLSGTGAFSDAANLTLNNYMIPFDVNSPLWSDAAAKTRWIAVPNDGAPYAANESIVFAPAGEWTFPEGTVLVKHFELNTDERTPAQRQRLETRLLVVQNGGGVYGVTYKWRSDNTNADLLPDALDEDITITQADGSTRIQTWHYPSRSECLNCHTPAAGGVLGPKTRQLNGNLQYPGGVTDNQLRTWNHIRVFSTVLNEADIPSFTRTVKVSDTSAPLETRVRSYLDANCSHCHRPGGAPAQFDARFDTPLTGQNLLEGAVANSFGIANPKVIARGSMARSIAHLRMSALGANQMPPLARNVVDTAAVDTLREWIHSMAATPTNLTAVTASSSQVGLAWTDNGDGEAGFRVLRSGNGVDFTEAASLTANTTAAADTGLSAATLYYYRISAVAPGGDTALSEIVSTTTFSDGGTTPPPPPPDGGDGDFDGDGLVNSADDDDDNDGVSDANELAAGTDPMNPASIQKLTLNVAQLRGTLKFNQTGRDACSVAGTIAGLPAGFSLAGQKLTLNVGGAAVQFTLDKKGRAKNGASTFNMRLKSTAAFKAALKGGAWADDWADEGIDPTADASNQALLLVVDVTFNGQVYSANVPVKYSGKKGKNGRFRN